MPRGATTNDLRDTFADYGPLRDVYIPNNFRGFGFVTFPSQFAADAALNSTHTLKVSFSIYSFCFDYQFAVIEICYGMSLIGEK